MKKEAIKFAQIAHEGQFRRDGITPHFSHCAAVAARLGRAFVAAKTITSKEAAEEMTVGFLHDILEKTKATVAMMHKAGIPESVTSVVQILTQGKDEDWVTYLRRIRLNEAARRVKIAEILCNLADIPTDEQLRKYGTAFTELTE